MSEAALLRAEPLASLADAAPGILDAPPALAELLPIGIYACDARGRLRWCNDRAAGIWGRTPSPGESADRIGGRSLDGEPPVARALRTKEPVRDATIAVGRPDGAMRFAAVDVEPVKDERGRTVGAIACLRDVTHEKRAEERLRESERRSRELLDALPAAVYTTDAKGRITFYNEAAVKLSGRRPALGSDEWCVTWRLYNPDGSPLPHDECPMAQALKEDRPIRNAEAIAERPDGTRVPFIPFPTPLHDASGALVGAVNMLVDISERKQSESRQRALIAELNHRVKNTLATVQSLAAQTLRGDGAAEEAQRAFERRLLALSEAHDQLSRSAWESAELSAVLAGLFAPFGGADGGRVSLDGEPVELPPRVALTLAMVLHELAANAAKYGALSVPGGRVAVAWSTADDASGQRLLLEWRETGGPPVAEPARRGFGARLLEHGVGCELQGEAQLRFDPAGVHVRIEAPLRRRSNGI
jgi:PAS domain S-box-containing protein